MKSNRIGIWRSERNRNGADADWLGDVAQFMGYAHRTVQDGLDGLEEIAVLIIPPHTLRMSDEEMELG